MAHCKINSLNDSKGSSTNSENLPRDGLVNEVCREWVLHEDQALAYRLQSEEYQHHLGHNRQRNAILRSDAPRAKEEQLKEDEEAAQIQMELERELTRQEARDSALASAIGHELDKQELERKRIQEFSDAELAKKIVEEEKTRLRKKKEIRQVEREAAYLGINSGLDNVAILSRKNKRESSRGSQESNLSAASTPSAAVEEGLSNRRGQVNSPPPDDFSDLSDFCLQPSSSMDEDEMKHLQEEQDEELARLLQEQDLKRRGDQLQENQLLAIEAQDKELAKVLQEQERAKSKKAREKARHKAALRQQVPSKSPEVAETSPPPRPSKSNSSSEASENHYATISSPRTPPEPSRRPLSPQYATPMPVVQVEAATRQQSPDRGDRVFPSPVAPSPSTSGFANIACAIDPTYERRVRTGELTPDARAMVASTHTPPRNPTATNRNESRETANLRQNSPTEDDFMSPRERSNESAEEDSLAEDDYLPPPYMPIQGQRRTASLEKRKKEAPGCRQQ